MKCKLCGKEVNQTQGRNRTKCHTCVIKIRRQRVKMAAVKLLGGRCVRCGFEGNIIAFDFHHPGDKDFKVSNFTHRSWEFVRVEVLKCELLCSNCHRIEHSDRDDPKFLAEVDNYQGTLLT